MSQARNLSGVSMCSLIADFLIWFSGFLDILRHLVQRAGCGKGGGLKTDTLPVRTTRADTRASVVELDISEKRSQLPGKLEITLQAFLLQSVCAARHGICKILGRANIDRLNG